MRSKTAYERIRFEGFEADFGSGELFYEGRKIPLQEQPLPGSLDSAGTFRTAGDQGGAAPATLACGYVC